MSIDETENSLSFLFALKASQQKLETIISSAADTPTIRAVTSEMLGSIVSQLADVSLGVRRLITSHSTTENKNSKTTASAGK